MPLVVDAALCDLVELDLAVVEVERVEARSPRRELTVGQVLLWLKDDELLRLFILAIDHIQLPWAFLIEHMNQLLHFLQVRSAVVRIVHSQIDLVFGLGGRLILLFLGGLKIGLADCGVGAREVRILVLG